MSELGARLRLATRTRQIAGMTSTVQATVATSLATLQHQRRITCHVLSLAGGSEIFGLVGNDRPILSHHFWKRLVGGVGGEGPASREFGVVRRTGPKFLSELCNFASAKFRALVSA